MTRRFGVILVGRRCPRCASIASCPALRKYTSWETWYVCHWHDHRPRDRSSCAVVAFNVEGWANHSQPYYCYPLPCIQSTIASLAILGTVTNLAMLDSAKALGDEHPVVPALVFSAAITMVSAVLGCPFPTSVYIGATSTVRHSACRNARKNFKLNLNSRRWSMTSFAVVNASVTATAVTGGPPY